MNEDTHRVDKCQPNTSRAADRADGRDTTEQTADEKSDSRDGASPSQRVQIGHSLCSSTDGRSENNADDVGRLVTDGGQLQTRAAPDAADPLTRFQLEILYELAAKLDQSDYGLGIKTSLENYYDEDVNHGRLYPNLDDLVERGLVEKSAQDKRTNEYELTPAGKELVVEDATRRDATADDLLDGGA